MATNNIPPNPMQKKNADLIFMALNLLDCEAHSYKSSRFICSSTVSLSSKQRLAPGMSK